MDQIYKDILSFQYKVNDRIDDHSHGLAKQLKQEVQRLEDEAQVRKNPRSLEDRVKRIVGILEGAFETDMMSNHHISDLINKCENFRHQLKKLF